MPPKSLKAGKRVEGNALGIQNLRGVIIGSDGNGGQKRWRVRWDDGNQRAGFPARSLKLLDGVVPVANNLQNAEAGAAGAAQAAQEGDNGQDSDRDSERYALE